MEEPNLNRTERAILRILYYADRELSTNQIAQRMVISPITTKKKLKRLKKIGLVKSSIGKIRTFERFGKSITSKRVILWKLNIKR